MYTGDDSIRRGRRRGEVGERGVHGRRLEAKLEHHHARVLPHVRQLRAASAGGHRGSVAQGDTSAECEGSGECEASVWILEG